MMRRLSGALGLGAALCLVLGAAPRAQTVDAPPRPQTATESAQAALAAGNTEMARLLALAGLQENPRDAEALTILAAVALAHEQSRAAGKVALKAWDVSETKTQKFMAARLVARAAYDLRAHEYSKRWLRRAVQFAPDTATRNATIRDFLTVRGESPVTLDFRLSLSPSDNLNQGARDPMLVIDGRPTYFTFDGSTMALSGAEAHVAAGLRYRVSISPSGQTDLTARVRHRSVVLSDQARALAPGVQNADLATWDLETGLTRSLRLSERDVLRFGGSLSQSWFGGEAYATTLQGQADLTRTLSPTLRLRLGLSAEHQMRQGGGEPATALTFDGGLERVLASGDRLGLRLDLGATLSPDDNQKNARISGEVRYLMAEPVAGARLSAALGFSYRDYPVFFNNVFSTTGRQDATVSASVDIALPQLGAYGFEPVVTLKGSQTHSNVSRYETRALGLGISLQSSF